MRHILLALICLIPINALAQVGEDKLPQAEKPKRKPTVKDYETYYHHYKNWSENLSNDEFWKNVTLKHNKTDKVVKFSDLPAYERAVFYFMSGQKLSQELAHLHKAWKKELEEVDEKEGASKEDVEKYIERLFQLRKDTAVRVEKVTVKLLEDYKHKFTDEERQKYLDEIKEWHDSEKLIERKDD